MESNTSDAATTSPRRGSRLTAMVLAIFFGAALSFYHSGKTRLAVMWSLALPVWTAAAGLIAMTDVEAAELFFLAFVPAHIAGVIWSIVTACRLDTAQYRSNPALQGYLFLMVPVLLMNLFASQINEAMPFEARSIVSDSMSPTLLPGDRVLADKRRSTLQTLGPGDIVVARDEGRVVIRRIAALHGGTGSQAQSSANEADAIVPAGAVILTGDKRDTASDNGMRVIERDRIFGKVVRLTFSTSAPRFWINLRPRSSEQ